MSLRRLDPQSLRGDRDAANLLSPAAYDDDASSLNSRSDQESDSDDDELQRRARSSRELRAADRMVFMEEDEVDRLVTDTRKQQQGRDRRGSALNLPNPLRLLRRASDSNLSVDNESLENTTPRDEKHRQRRTRRREKKKRLTEKAAHGEDGELMYEMEAGGMREGSTTGDSSDRDDSEELDRRRLDSMANAASDRRRSWRRWIFIHVTIAIGFAILVLLAWKLSLNRKDVKGQTPQLVSNGTALFAPTTIIISLDGFRADFLQRGITPRLNAFIKEGVSPKFMLPSFPSVTFPNHYTLATGLYPESHGVVGNTFWDPALKSEFYYTDPERSLDAKWWNGEPFWVTAEKQGIRSAIHMWPGSEAHILGTEPSFLDRYNGKEILPNKVNRILEFLDKPGQEDKNAKVGEMRPQLIAAYVPNVDSDGHRYGPNSTEIRATIQSVDGMLDSLFTGLEERNLTNIVNVIIVSDHGMATTDTSRLLQLEDLIDTTKIEHNDGWPLYGLRPKNPNDLRGLYEGLEEKAKQTPNFDVYLRDVNMPERYHFSKSQRIAPLWIIPKTGWAIVKKEEFVVAEALKNGDVYHPRGLHGYDNEHPLMRAIFVARGPAFPHPPNSRIDPFQNIEVYNILCDSIGLQPMANNGTLRLPLKPLGKHEPEDENPVPEDPVTPAVSPVDQATPLASQITPTTSAKTKPLSTKTVSAQQYKTTAPFSESSEVEGGDDPNDDLTSSFKHAWDWVTGKIGDIWHDITGSSKDEDKSEKDDGSN